MAQQVVPAAHRPRAFTTVGLPWERRVELWEAHNAASLIGLRCRTLNDEQLTASEVNLQLDTVHLARVRSSSHVVERDAALVHARPADAIALFFSLAGEAFFYDDEGVRVLQPGQLLVCDADRPFVRGFSRGLEELVLKIPRHDFRELTGLDAVKQPVTVDFGDRANASARALAHLVAAATRADSDAPVAEDVILALVVDVVGAGDPHGTASAHLAALEAYVGQHLGDHRLSATSAAAAVGVSTRQLSRILAQVDTSFPRYVTTRRLEAARAMIRRSGKAVSVTEVARRCGFVSASHFSNSFAAHFGERPSDLLRASARDRGGHRSVPPLQRRADLGPLGDGARGVELGGDVGSPDHVG